MMLNPCPGWATGHLLGVAALATALLVPGAAHAQQRWTVRSGDALSVLAQRFDTTVEQLRDWNDLPGDQIQVGQRLVVSEDGAAAPRDGLSPEYVVGAGDTLSGIAVAHGISLEQLLAWNEGLDADRIRVGQRLQLRDARRRVTHEVRPGDSLSALARRHETTVAEILRLNAGVSANRIRIGQELVLYSRKPESHSKSIGAPNGGRLERGARLPPHPGYIIRNRSVAWGTVETVEWMTDAFDAVRQRFPRSPRVRVHDISRRRGGWLHGHRSHQSGRDVDVSYYQRRCGGVPCPMRRIEPADLDVRRQWALFESWLRNDRVEAIFMDYRLQGALYQHARSRGATRQELHRWFQYPRGPSFPLGAIRHFRQHRDHFHVRFRCHESDEECR